MSALRRVRTVAATTLAGGAWVLGLSAKVVETAARAVRPAPSVAEQVAVTYQRRGRVQPPPVQPAPGPRTARVAATHVEELAARPASEVVARVPGLSTDELRRLLEHEQAGRRRKTVLAAIERAAVDHTV